MNFKSLFSSLFLPPSTTQGTTAATSELGSALLAQNSTAIEMATLAAQKKVLPYTIKAISRTRQDIKKWTDAQNLSTAEEPKNWLLQNILADAGLDALLTSQLQNRLQQCMAMPYSLVNDKGEIDEEQTAKLKKSQATAIIHQAIWESRLYGYNLAELHATANTLLCSVIPRQHVVPQKGLFYADYTEDKSIAYRQLKEYGTWLLEFYTGETGLLNKAVPHVLFKRFAQSCWSELCELYGIPPRVLKINTQDSDQLNRAEAMMRDMSAAAWFIIDNEENFEWAKATDTNGDVYKQLINLCNNEISLLITGAVIGQDTKNGSRSKDESGQQQLQQLVASDLIHIASHWNSTVIPALVNIGYLKGDSLRLQFDKVPNLQELWNITIESLPYFTIDPQWAKKTFGIEITGERKAAAGGTGNLYDSSHFFG